MEFHPGGSLARTQIDPGGFGLRVNNKFFVEIHSGHLSGLTVIQAQQTICNTWGNFLRDDFQGARGSGWTVFRVVRYNEAAGAAEAAAYIKVKTYLRLKEEEQWRTISGVNARSNTLTNINNKAFRATTFFAMASAPNPLNSHLP